MKAKLVPLFFRREKTEKFAAQLMHLDELLGDSVEFLQPAALEAGFRNVTGLFFRRFWARRIEV